MKTLYVTDLDGTLLNSNDMLSKYTVKTLNSLISAGMCFSYATARSLSSASFVTKGLTINIPVIIYNGTFIVKHDTKEKLFSLSFGQNEKEKVMEKLTENSIFPLVYGYINGEEKVSWIKSKVNDGMAGYINSRKEDRRLREVENAVKVLKEYATGIIKSNDEDGVARWLVENYRKE